MTTPTRRRISIGISAGLTALWVHLPSVWLFYTASTLSSIGFSAGSLVFPLVFWGAIAMVAGFVSVAFLLRYSKQP